MKNKTTQHSEVYIPTQDILAYINCDRKERGVYSGLQLFKSVVFFGGGGRAEGGIDTYNIYTVGQWFL